MILTDFLLARIAEDEAVALEANWRFSVPNETPESAADHIARHDPARVLDECDAKRRIVEEHVPYWRRCQTCGGVDYPVEWPCPTLRLLALPYASHPDYDERWRP